MEQQDYTEKHIHAISIAEADRSLLNRESALRRILHILQGDAIDFGIGRGTVHISGRQELADKARCKVRNVRSALTRLRETRWIVNAMVPGLNGSFHSGFMVAMRHEHGFGSEISEAKLREATAETGDESVMYERQCSGNVAARKRQGSGNVDGKEAAIRRQGSGNVDETDVAPKRRKAKTQTFREINNTYVRSTDGDQVPLSLDPPKPRKHATGAKAKTSPLDALGQDIRDWLFQISDQVFEHEQRRYREHKRCRPDDPGPVHDRQCLAEALHQLGGLSNTNDVLDLGRAVVEFRWGHAAKDGEKAESNWEYWDSMWSPDSVKRVYGWLQEPRNDRYIYLGMAKTREEFLENKCELVAYRRGLDIGSSAVTSEAYGLRV